MIAGYTYAEDAAGNITQIHDAVDSTYNRDFVYDDLNRLITANSGSSLWGSGSYTYDALGNMRSRDLGSTVEVDPNDPLSRTSRFAAHPDALPAPGSVHETYGGVGTTAQLATVTFDGIDHLITYDATGNEVRYYDPRGYSPRNLMSSITEPSEDNRSHTVNYAYDGRGVRVTRSEGTSGYATPFANRYYVYSPELQLLAVSVDDNPNIWGKTAIVHTVPAIKREIVWFNGTPVYESVDTTSRYTFTDHLGTPILQTDTSAAISWRAEYEPFGDVWTMRAGTPTDQLLRFPGQEYERRWEGMEERYNIFRWYRAGWGRYTQADPIGIKGGLNLYRYGNANPIGAIDQTGLAVNLVCRRVNVGQGLLAGLVGAWLVPVHCRLEVSCACDRESNPRTPFRKTVGLEATGGGYQLNTDNFLAPRFGGPSQDYDKGWFSVPVTPPSDAKGCGFERCILNEARARENTQSFPSYNIAGPNSNSYVRNLVDTCGGSAEWPKNAYGADPNPFWGGNYRP
jgi:RHS repeat-associated protein